MEMIMFLIVLVVIVGFGACLLWFYIKINEVYGVPHPLIDLKNWIIRKLRG
jgi:hypothetical protein